MINNYKIRSHFESGIGLGIEGTLPEGKVTLFRIGGKELDKIWTAEGSIVISEHQENLCRTQAAVKLDDPSSLDGLLRNPLGNHLLLMYGSHSKELNDFKMFIENYKGNYEKSKSL
jgi:L-fucose isomerase-like protein